MQYVSGHAMLAAALIQFCLYPRIRGRGGVFYI